MTQRSYFWDGATGDGGNYSSTELMDYVFRAIFGTAGDPVGDPGSANRGVLYGWLNQLRVIDRGPNLATVDTGGAIKCGLVCEKTTPLEVVIPNGPRTDLLVLRRSWAGQTIRVVRVAAMTRNFGVTYDIPLARVVVGAGGNLTITDTREFCQFSFLPGEASIWNSDLTTGGGILTTATLENQTRSHFHGVGELKSNFSFGSRYCGFSAAWWWEVNNVGWRCSESGTSTLWLTDRIDDLAGTDVNLYVWNMPALDTSSLRHEAPQTTGDAVWGYAAWIGASGGAWATPSATIVVGNADRLEIGSMNVRNALRMYRDYIGTIAVTANDLIHLKVYLDGTNPLDTRNLPTRWMGVELEYEADS